MNGNRIRRWALVDFGEGWKMILVMPDDICFTNSPDAGDPACLCSRCKQPITEEDAEKALPIRVWPDEGRGGEYREYRYHPWCLGLRWNPPVWSAERR